MAKTKPTNSGNKENEELAGAKKAIWTNIDDSIMMWVLKEQKALGHQSDSEWKSCVWTAVAAALLKESHSKGAVKDASKISDHFSKVNSFTPLFFYAHLLLFIDENSLYHAEKTSD